MEIKLRKSKAKYHKEIASILRPGEFVKVSDGRDAFWVKIIHANGRLLINHNTPVPTAKSKTMSGVISNKLTGGQKYNYGSVIKFKSINILDIRHSKINDKFLKKYGRKAKSKKISTDDFFKNINKVFNYYLKTGEILLYANGKIVEKV